MGRIIIELANLQHFEEALLGPDDPHHVFFIHLGQFPLRVRQVIQGDGGVGVVDGVLHHIAHEKAEWPREEQMGGRLDL